MDITFVRWPVERDRLTELRKARTPRLILVDEDAPVPIVVDEYEDWVRVPAPEEDVRARVAGVSMRAQAAGLRIPDIDEYGVVRFSGAHTSVPPVEARLAQVLIERFGAVVGRGELSEAGWPGGHASRNALDVHVLRLRRRLDEAGLSIRTVRARGYLLESADNLSAI
jgi:two-component system OmpR family response regulator